MNNIFNISDLHLGDRGFRDNFSVGDREKRLYRFLDYVDEQNGRLIILGDLLELLQTSLCRVLPAYGALLTRLYAMRQTAWWILGNHEAGIGSPAYMVPLGETPPRRGPLVETIGGRRILFCHGHEFDSACNNVNPGIDTLTAVATALLEEKNHGPIKDGDALEDTALEPLEKLSSLYRTLLGHPTRSEEFLAGAEKYRVEQGADCLICGHTHTPGHWGNIWNSGCWCRNKDTFIRITDGQPQLFLWDGNKPLEFSHLNSV